jgi:hypothetical protein
VGKRHRLEQFGDGHVFDFRILRVFGEWRAGDAKTRRFI